MFSKNQLGYCLCLFALLACGPQVLNSEKNEVVTKKTTEVGDSGGEVATDSGSVVVPAGVLAAGSSVSVEKASTPDAFSANENVSEASKAVQISAKDKNGNPIAEVSQPMTISLSMEGAALWLSVEKKSENLCALLSAVDKSLVVWRYSALTVESSKVSFLTKKFGTFQLVYCGQETLQGFNEADPAVTGEETVTLALDIPADQTDYGQKKYCAGVARFEMCDSSASKNEDCGSKDGTVIGGTEVAAKLGSKQTLEVKVAPSAVLSGKDYVMSLFMLTDSQSCPFKVGEEFSFETTVNAKSSLFFLVDEEKVKSGHKGTLHEAGGNYATQELSFSLESGAATPPTIDTICISIDGENALTMLTESISANGFSSGSSDIQVRAPATLDTSSRIEIAFGSKCAFDYAQENNIDTGLPYTVRFHAQSENDFQNGVAIAPIKLDISSSLSLIADNGCFSLFSPGSTSSNLEDSGLSTLLSLQNTSYTLYAPVYGTGAQAVADMRMDLLSEDKKCGDTNSVIPAIEISSQPILNAVQLQQQ